MIIKFLPDNKSIETDGTESILELAGKAGVIMEGCCGGKGKCGRCKVKVISGEFKAADEAEKKVLTSEDVLDGVRLSCRLYPVGDSEINVEKLQIRDTRKTRLITLPEDFAIDPNIKKICVNIEKASLKNQTSCDRKIIDAINDKSLSMALSAVKQLPAIFTDSQIQSNIQLTAVIAHDKIIALESGDTSKKCFGVAFDIGTTSVVAILWDLDTGRQAATRAMLNPQSVYGADVITRINYAAESNENLLNISKKIRGCLNALMLRAAADADVDPNNIYEATIVGNTTMSNLFLGITPVTLSHAPFVPLYTNAISLGAKESSIKINPCGSVYVLANIASHVGSDLTAGIIATSLFDKKGVHILIDVGTNGEIIGAANGKLFACSTAAGPAFEGASIYQGMRATDGAIETVKISDEGVELKVIGDVAPKGICGSGLIDVVAQMLNAGIINFKGKIASKEKELSELPPALSKRCRLNGRTGEFVLAFGKNGNSDVVITQNDIREVQLAKGAICAGIKVMTAVMGKVKIDNLMIAGAFGSYINKYSALMIGLFPDMDEDDIISVGNAAGIGSSMALMSVKEREKSETDAANITHIELSDNPNFQDEYISRMNFPKKALTESKK